MAILQGKKKRTRYLRSPQMQASGTMLLLFYVSAATVILSFYVTSCGGGGGGAVGGATYSLHPPPGGRGRQGRPSTPQPRTETADAKNEHK